MSEEAPVSAAVIHMLDGGLVPDEEERAPLRRIEMAAIWRAEAEAELSEAICAAKDSGESFAVIAGVLGTTAEGVRARYVSVKRRSGGHSV